MIQQFILMTTLLFALIIELSANVSPLPIALEDTVEASIDSTIVQSDFLVLEEVDCDIESGTFSAVFLLPDIGLDTNVYEYRICGDAAWTEVPIPNGGTGLVIIDSLLTSYCVEFRSSAAPNAIQTYQRDNINCFLLPFPYFANIQVFLEGAYDENTGLMKTLLQENEVLPLTQPYNVAPYNYEGTETLDTFEINQLGLEVVDWVLVEVRTGTPSLTEQNTTLFTAKAGLLLNTGQIVDVTGDVFYFEHLDEGIDFHICVRHRNHLDVLSAKTIAFANFMATYDFTISSSQAFGNFQQKTLSNGKAALFVGDYLQDGVIQLSDFDAWKANPAQLNVYSVLDGTLDGVVQQTDNDAWLPNKAKIGVAEIRF